MASTHQSLRVVPSIIALALVAGTALPVFADNKAQPKVAVTSTKSSGSLALNGTVFHTTAARITNQRTLTWANSNTTVIVWDEFAGGAKSSWYAISNDGVSIDQVTKADNRVQLRYAQFDPIAGEPAIPASLRAGAGNELYIVQFVATPIQEMRSEVAALGGVVEGFLPDNAHMVRMPANAVANVAALPSVRWVGIAHPAYRISNEVRDVLLATAGPEAAAERYSIACFRSGPSQQQAVANAITAMGGMVDTVTPDMFRMEATLTPAQLAQVIQRNEVAFVDPWGGPGGTDMDIARQIGGAVPTLSNAGFLGQGVRGEVFDTVANDTHIQWNIAGGGHGPLHHGPNGSSGSHGEATYGINFATGNGDVLATGMVPQNEAGIFFWYTRCSQFTAGQPSRLAMNIEATDPLNVFKSSYQTSSVGGAQITTYSTLSQETDDYLFKIDYLSCQSQSNTGNMTSRPQAWAKNILSVGGVVHQNTLTRADDVWGGASYGPAADGRIKPDLWHFYDSIYTTWTGNTYTQFSGTSGATPIVAGHSGLLAQMWHQGVWAGFGGGATVFSDRPFSTTSKALLCNTAFKYTVTATNTRVRQGWGMPDVGYLYNIRNKTFIVNADQPVGNAQTRTYTVNVTAGEPELRVTMCYIDPAPLALVSPNRVNNLSLRVTSPGGTQYWGNFGLTADNISDPGGAENTLDTVENVFLPNPAAGAWVVEVIGSQVVTDAYPTGKPGVTPNGAIDAGFSLVVTGATGGSQPPVCYANCDGSSTPPILNVNDFICFNNLFAAGSSLANCDGSTTPPVLNVNDFSCFTNLYAAGCP